jgi:hypothetical protein
VVGNVNGPSQKHIHHIHALLFWEVGMHILSIFFDMLNINGTRLGNMFVIYRDATYRRREHLTSLETISKILTCHELPFTARSADARKWSFYVAPLSWRTISERHTLIF